MNLLERLPSHGIELEIGLPRSRPSEGRPGWRVHHLVPGRGLRWYFAPFAFVPFTVRALREQRVDLLRGHSVRFTGPSLFLARMISRVELPIVLHYFHSEGAWQSLDAVLLRRADAVVTTSARSREALIGAGVAENIIHVVSPGVELIPASAEAAPAQTWPAEGLRILFLGRLIERKRPDVALLALRRLLDDGCPASLVVAGEGPLRPTLEAHAEALELSTSVKWLGRVDERTKWSLYLGADVLVYPSTLEGFGLVVAEAQRAGLPVVAAQGTATAEIVEDGETGFLVQPGVTAFASALRQLANPRLRASFARRALERGVRFDWDATAARIAEIYIDLVRSYVPRTPSPGTSTTRNAMRSSRRRLASLRRRSTIDP